MRHGFVFVVLVSMIVTACAQVPKESVELSTTIGRDLASVHKAHRELSKVVFSRMRKDINRFVDGIYAPYQINQVMARQKQLANSDDSEDRKKSLLLAINAAFTSDAPPQLQEAVLKGMNSMVLKIRKDVESMRKELLDPINAQEKEVLSSIDRSYQQLHYANSIVTGYLSSVVKVHDTQADLLEAIGVERDLRTMVGQTLSITSDKIAGLVDAADAADEKLAKAEETAKKLKDAVGELKNRLSSK